MLSTAKEILGEGGEKSTKLRKVERKKKFGIVKIDAS
jgi:hypothetical protein